MTSPTLEATVARAGTVPERDFRGPGCGERCRVVAALVPGIFGRSELLLHDPGAHEAYGRRLAAQLGTAALIGTVVMTGRLAVNTASHEVAIDGHPVRLTATEGKILRTLAAAVGMVVSYEVVERAAWGDGVDDTPEPSNRHAIRVHLARLRAKLGPDGALVQTVTNEGCRLAAIPPGDPAPEPARPFHRLNVGPRPWSHAWEACLACGEARYPHAGHGYCTACRDRANTAYQRPRKRTRRTR